MCFEEPFHILPHRVGREQVRDADQSHQPEASASVPAVELVPLLLQELPGQAAAPVVGRHGGYHEYGVLQPHVVGERPVQRLPQQILLLEPRNRNQEPDLLLVQFRCPLQVPHAFVDGPVTGLCNQAEYHAAQVRSHVRGIVLVRREEFLGLRDNVRVPVYPGLAEHGGPGQRIQVSFPRPRVPARPLRRRTE